MIINIGNQVLDFNKQKCINILWHLLIGFLSSWAIFLVSQFSVSVNVAAIQGFTYTVYGAFWLMSYQIIHYCILMKNYSTILMEILDLFEYALGGMTVLIILNF